MVFEEFWIYAKGIKIRLRKEGALLYYDLWVKIKNWLVLLAWCDLCRWKCNWSEIFESLLLIMLFCECACGYGLVYGWLIKYYYGKSDFQI